MENTSAAARPGVSHSLRRGGDAKGDAMPDNAYRQITQQEAAG
jgi:hypothetical protein